MTRIEEIKQRLRESENNLIVINNTTRDEFPPRFYGYGVGTLNEENGIVTPIIKDGLPLHIADLVANSSNDIRYLLELVENGSDCYHTEELLKNDLD